MPAKRRKRGPRFVITQAAIEEWVEGSSITSCLAWPWMPFLRGVTGPEPYADASDSERESWAEAWALRQALDAAVAQVRKDRGAAARRSRALVGRRCPLRARVVALKPLYRRLVALLRAPRPPGAPC
jgi:hypothetical protein